MPESADRAVDPSAPCTHLPAPVREPSTAATAGALLTANPPPPGKAGVQPHSKLGSSRHSFYRLKTPHLPTPINIHEYPSALWSHSACLAGSIFCGHGKLDPFPLPSLLCSKSPNAPVAETPAATPDPPSKGRTPLPQSQCPPPNPRNPLTHPRPQIKSISLDPAAGLQSLRSCVAFTFGEV